MRRYENAFQCNIYQTNFISILNKACLENLGTQVLLNSPKSFLQSTAGVKQIRPLLQNGSARHVRLHLRLQVDLCVPQCIEHGANNVANGFATSVSPRLLTMRQAMFMATIMEFGGAVLAGSRVADTIRNKIINVKNFDDNPSILMLGMLCTLVGSSLWSTLSTKIGLPVSTT